MDNSLFKKRPTKVLINLKNIENNLHVLRELAPNKKIMGIVKADAYGHGLIEISKKYESLNLDYLGVAYLEEALILRKSGIKIPILVLGAIHTEQIKEYLLHNIELTGSSIEKIREVSNVAKKLNKKAQIHLKIDTGMGRIGVQWDRIERFAKELVKLENFKYLNIVGIYTHFSSSDTDPKFTNLQYFRFESALEILSAYINPNNVLIHIANSLIACNYPKKFQKDMVRTGLLLYGYSANKEIQKKLKPVMSFKTEISYFKVLEKGCPVGYQKQYTTKKQTRIVTLPVGYADGYPVEFSNNAFVYINSKKHPVVGRICMDQCMVDIGNTQAYVGDEVELFGENISLWNLTENSSKSPYTVLAGISQRVPRVYV